MSFEDKLSVASAGLLLDPNFIDHTLPTGLWFCADIFDANAVKINAVSLHTGGGWDDLNGCEDFLQSFCYILVVCADPKRRKDMAEQLQARVTAMPILVAEDKAYRGCKSVAELRDQHGPKAVDEMLFHTRELPAHGLLNLADVKKPDVSKLPRVLSGIQALDRETGGFLMGMLSVWTGKRGTGKSTLLGQLLLEAIDQGETVCAYSGELPDWQFKQWAYLQAAGPEHIIYTADPMTGQRMADVPSHIAARIDEWWDKQFLLYDLGISSAHDEDSIMKVFEYAHRRYGASVFLVDNIMTARFKTARDADFYRAQSNFVGRLVEFAKKNNVHVHMVAHPRKSEKGSKYLGADDVGGSGDITNRADNIFSLEREAKKKDGDVEFQTILSIIKNRMYGRFQSIALEFDEGSKRFYRPKTAPGDRRLAWDQTGHQIRIEDVPPDDYDPFPKGG